MSEHKGWHFRGYIPHFDAAGKVQSLVIRLADSMPAEVLGAWEEEMRKVPPAERHREKYDRIEAYLNAGHGSCLLREPGAAQAVENALFFFDEERYRLHAWCVMPNHLHVLLEQFEGFTLGELIKSWKVNTTKVINGLYGRSGQLWFDDYYDRYIRDENHFADAAAYIDNNPVAAGLCKNPQDWTFGSARRKFEA